ncbi:hypothetical protein P7K49_009577 [Saguinus oedipus]|uniref:Uncharacterized protein n=1 Tax=Saguinus oedipus TaxID=9490 RepID=A0ABQ9VKC1_SAGOE|nr:hypothetical protein P7K49_009577 [Saguinus oedipus]
MDPGGWGWPPGHAPRVLSCSPLGGLLQLAAEVNVSSRVALGMSSRGTPILTLKRCSTLLGHISLFSGCVGLNSSHPHLPHPVQPAVQTDRLSPPPRHRDSGSVHSLQPPTPGHAPRLVARILPSPLS